MDHLLSKDNLDLRPVVFLKESQLRKVDIQHEAASAPLSLPKRLTPASHRGLQVTTITIDRRPRSAGCGVRQIESICPTPWPAASRDEYGSKLVTVTSRELHPCSSRCSLTIRWLVTKQDNQVKWCLVAQKILILHECGPLRNCGRRAEKRYGRTQGSLPIVGGPRVARRMDRGKISRLILVDS